MTDKEYFRQLRIPTPEDPLRILISACLTGIECGVDGTANGEYPGVLKLLKYDNVKIVTFCPEDDAFGTPRDMCDIYGGTGFDVLDGNASVRTPDGTDWTEGMIRAAGKMLAIAQKHQIEVAVMMDISAACGSQVIYDGNRYAADKKYQAGMGVCAARLHRAGFKIVSQRDFATLELLYAKLDPAHIVNSSAVDHDEHEWYRSHFQQ